jgi:hypothetical protein
MSNLMRAHNELFRRSPDECFDTFDALWAACRESKERCTDRWHPPSEVQVLPAGEELRLRLAGADTLGLNDWSFAQLCSLAGVAKETVNKLSASTSSRVFAETLPTGAKPLQILSWDDNGDSYARSIHGASYTRLYDVDLLSMVREFATDFQPAQTAAPADGADESTAAQSRGTGMYRGEQDMFCFLIDPLGWTEIEGQAFAPGFFVWNSEVGRRTVGIQTFWFQAVCQNHIVWDAVEVVEFSRKHTANVHEAFSEIRRIICRLAEKRDQRRDGFAAAIKKAMQTRLGDSRDDVLKLLAKRGLARTLAKRALDMAQQNGAMTIFAVVDALTQLAGEGDFAGQRTDIDAKASALLELAA